MGQNEAGQPKTAAPQFPGQEPGIVVLYSSAQDDFACRHEIATRTGIARRLAALKGYDFAGDYDPAHPHPGPVYFVPAATLVGIETATALGIRDEHDIFGGVAPFPFVATKAITQPLVEPDARAPAGWSHDFKHRVRDAVLPGFSVFTIEDARRAGVRLLQRGPARLKPVHATGGRGQSVIADIAELEAALYRIDLAELTAHGFVLEQNLTEVMTYSVGQVRVADLVASYFGTQRLTPDNDGVMVYGGSELMVIRGDFPALLRHDLPDEARLAVTYARTYDAAATQTFPGLLASRRNYDVACGLDADGQRRCGVLEQSWRIGGASSAEIAALEAFRADPALPAVRASCIELYGDSPPPTPHATVYFRDTDEQVGPITKYALAEP
jgi:hypothetical protein